MASGELALLTSPGDGLPPGWSMEIRVRKDGKKDKYYIDPVEGYMFRSRKEVSRYLDTKEVGDKAKRRIINDVESKKQTLSCAIAPFGGNLNSKEAISWDPWYPKTAKRRRSRPKQKKRRVNAQSTTNVVETINTVEGLPPGWIQEIRSGRTGHGKYSFYIDPVEGYMFRSKKEVFRYLDTGEVGNRATKRRNNNGVESKNRAISVIQTFDTAEGLPLGWVKETRVKMRGDTRERADSYYIDPVEGYVFRSRKEVSRYLDSKDVGGNKARKGTCTIYVESVDQEIPVVQTFHTAEGPPGWIKETRVKMRGGIRERADSYYIDPVEGYVFRSRKEVSRYLNSGEVGNRTRKRRCTNYVDSAGQEISLLPAPKRQNIGGSKARRCLFAGESSNPLEVKMEENLDSSVAEEKQSLSVHALEQSKNGRGCNYNGLAPHPSESDSDKAQRALVSLHDRNASTSNNDKRVDHPPFPPRRFSRRLAGLKPERAPESPNAPKIESSEKATDVETVSSVIPAVFGDASEKATDVTTVSSIIPAVFGDALEKATDVKTVSSVIPAVFGDALEKAINVTTDSSIIPAVFGDTSEKATDVKTVSSIIPELFGDTSDKAADVKTVSSVPTMFGDTSEKGTDVKTVSSIPAVFGDTSDKATDVKTVSSIIPAMFGHTWADPCIEFAFNTLTGALPLPEVHNSAIEDFFNQQVGLVSNKQKTSSLKPPPLPLPEVRNTAIEDFFHQQVCLASNTQKTSSLKSPPYIGVGSVRATDKLFRLDFLGKQPSSSTTQLQDNSESRPSVYVVQKNK